MRSLLIGALLGAIAGGISIARLKPSQPPPYGWSWVCGDKPEVVVWIDTPPATPLPAVKAFLYWSPTPFLTDGLWARAEGGGKVGLYVAVPHGSYLWPAWDVAGVLTSPSHSEWCP